ncbi:hypothetical protein U9M48_002075 [Paspalum notatum var. saurae]|uniref:CCHC-type domain-containing protein n=1 Tax=Paspalum notatum var. saurae TaxID=547442 RepID=A0AAQ3PGL7_PASNO
MAPPTANPGADLSWHTVKARHTLGRCFKCLAPDHRSSACRNAVRCFGCRRYGHRFRDCKLHSDSPVPVPALLEGDRQVVQPTTVTMVVLGDPCTRLDEESCIIPISFDIEQEAKEWESTVLIPWAFSLPQGAGVREIEATIMDELRLKCDEVSVSLHAPEAYLIKFEQKMHCEAAYRRHCIKRNGVVLCLRPYHSLEHAIGAFSSVISLWAWTRNPSIIPKKIGLTFTNRSLGDASSSWEVIDEFPSKWQFGSAFQVDGEPGPDRVYEHPFPPRVALLVRGCGRDDDRGRGRDDDCGRGRDDEDRRRPGQACNAPRSADDHPDFQPPRRRDESDDDEGSPGRHGHRCSGAWPLGRAWSWGLDGRRVRSRSPDRRGTGRASRNGYRRHHLHVPAGFEFKLPSLEELAALDREGLQKMFSTQAAALRTDLSHLLADHVQSSVADLLAPARAWLEDAVTTQKQWLHNAESYINKACQLADKINIAAAPLLPGNQACSRVAARAM